MRDDVEWAAGFRAFGFGKIVVRLGPGRRFRCRICSDMGRMHVVFFICGFGTNLAAVARGWVDWPSYSFPFSTLSFGLASAKQFDYFG